MTDRDPFVCAADRLLREVAEDLRATGLACELAGDVLAWRYGDGTRATLIRQAAVRQIWLADGVLAWYFDWCPDLGEWSDGRAGSLLRDVLAARMHARRTVHGSAG
jgi:frataxin-like iron-binding protein CyaY